MQLAPMLIGLACVFSGAWFILRSNTAAHTACQLDYRTFGIRLNSRFYEIAVLLGGLAFCAAGLMAMAGLIELPGLR